MQGLDDWFCKCKVNSSNPDTRPACGRLNPCSNIPLFASNTKSVVDNCKEKAIHLADPMSIEEMYVKIHLNPNSQHKLIEHVSKQGESKLESLHGQLAHFANSGMRDSLSDNLHLVGTARCNLSIYHKRSLITLENTKRSLIPAALDHTELNYISRMTIKVGCPPPFPRAKTLWDDMGEQFFSEHIKTVKPKSGIHNGNNCWCNIC